jgi:cytoplasmic iron level regulating protein YaaA (DUF328/UPF0246 family)
MLILISPAKTLDYQSPLATHAIPSLNCWNILSS